MRKFVGSEYGSLDAFALSDGEIPQPAQGEARLKVEATALGFVDGLIALGRYQIRPPLPYVPGGEIAGTVDATGPGVDAVVVGDRVVTWQLGGGLAEYVTVEAGAVEKIPAGLDATTAAAMLVDYQTAHYLSGCETSLARAMTWRALGRAHGLNGGS
jgi:NADPH:quinone reductase